DALGLFREKQRPKARRLQLRGVGVTNSSAYVRLVSPHICPKGGPLCWIPGSLKKSSKRNTSSVAKASVVGLRFHLNDTAAIRTSARWSLPLARRLSAA